MNFLNAAINVNFFDYYAAIDGVLWSIRIIVEVESPSATIGMYAMACHYLFIFNLRIDLSHWSIKIT